LGSIQRMKEEGIFRELMKKEITRKAMKAPTKGKV